MNVINDAYFNEKDQKLWKTGEQQLRISSVEQVKEMIPDMFVARNKISKEITGVVVAKIFIESKINGSITVEIGPLAVGKKFQVQAGGVGVVYGQTQGPLITDGRNCNEMWILSKDIL